MSRVLSRVQTGSMLAGVLLTGFAMAAGTAQAADIKERTIKFAFVQNMDNHWGAGAQKFAEIVNQKSDGKIKVKLFAGGTLGGDIQTVSSLQGGTIEMVMMGSGVLVGQIKEYVCSTCRSCSRARKKSMRRWTARLVRSLWTACRRRA